MPHGQDEIADVRGLVDFITMSFTRSVHHVVVGSKHRARVLREGGADRLYRFVEGVLEARKCYSYAINGVEDHIHLLFDLHPSLALSDVMREVKTRSAKFIKNSGMFPDFKCWQVAYGAFSCSQTI